MTDKPFDEESDMTPILLAERGDCTHAEKVKNAQDIGMLAVMLIDDEDDDYEQLRMKEK